jgi:hypothetical protein
MGDAVMNSREQQGEDSGHKLPAPQVVCATAVDAVANAARNTDARTIMNDFLGMKRDARARCSRPMEETL